MNSTSYPFDLLDVPGAHNVRDIGGYRGRDGKPVNKGRFIRSAGLHDLSADGVRALRDLGVDCIVDLRSKFEVQKFPDPLTDDPDIRYIHISMLDYIQSSIAEDDSAPPFPNSMAEMYTGLLDNSKVDFLRLMEVFADPAHNTVLFHCTAGKDRTGLTAMLLLGLAGVSREDIIADYVPSQDLVPPVDSDLPRHLFESAEETMTAALDHLNSRYGGIVGYLEHIGLEEEAEARLLAKLLGGG